MLRMERKTVPDHEVAMGALADITENDGQRMSCSSHMEALI